MLYNSIVNGIIKALSHPFWQQKGGVGLIALLVSFLVSVLASIVGCYVCKWLDGDDSDN